jgi:hypothetical protein
MNATPGHEHLSEETLILHYYNEADAAADVDAHLAACATCRDQFLRLRQVLTLVDLDEVPEPGPGFERKVWARLEPQIAQPRASPFDSLRSLRAWLARFFTAGPRWVYAGGIAALVLAAFIAGRISREVPAETPATTPVAADDELSNRVLVFAVVDHLDRTEMMLVELLNSEPSNEAQPTNGASRARDLVAENRLYRASATQAGDEAVTDVLDDLERVLIEIANTPETAGPGAFDALRQRIASQGLLFRVRVVHSEMRARERRTAAGSTS